eukprot:TRINITY_DN11481_c0_g1_i16.p1 TRINITY_DN11481_c0_g1~~TRINITY_DN11481_c0_g1_i16.p1  ORF type:complete len:287 (+),score=47.43 TRINITY_DN11481_c0_g1_i16:189-1049(+)
MSMLDNPMFVGALYHPQRRPIEHTQMGGAVYDGLIPTSDPEVQLGYRLMINSPTSALALHFHGNAEVAADVIHLRKLAATSNLSFLAVDYRGYGWSTGSPQISSLVQDAHAIAEAVPHICEEHGLTPCHVLAVGRSLGSVWAVELASKFARGEGQAGLLDGLVIESGFAGLKTLPIAAPLVMMGDTIPEPFDNSGKLVNCTLPVLVMHGDQDQIVPFAHAEQNMKHCGSRRKQLVTFRGAGHNDILARDATKYAAVLGEFVGNLGKTAAEVGSGTDESHNKCCSLM